MVDTRALDPVLTPELEDAAAGGALSPRLAVADSPAPASSPRTSVVREAPASSAAPAAAAIFVMSDECGDLLIALAAAQGEFAEVERTLEAKGSKYSFEYESLADVLAATRPALSRHGLALIQAPLTRAASVMVRTIVAFGVAGGRAQFFYNELVASVPDTAPQTIGSAITFLRRYGLKSLLGLAAGERDDDGAAASRTSPAPIESAAVRKDREAWPPATVYERHAKVPAAPAPRPEPDLRTAADTGPGWIGTVKTVRDVDGGALITLSTGARAGSRSPEIIAEAKSLLGTTARIELVVKPASAPGMAPAILELRPKDGEQ